MGDHRGDEEHVGPRRTACALHDGIAGHDGVRSVDTVRSEVAHALPAVFRRVVARSGRAVQQPSRIDLHRVHVSAVPRAGQRERSVLAQRQGSGVAPDQHRSLDVAGWNRPEAPGGRLGHVDRDVRQQEIRRLVLDHDDLVRRHRHERVACGARRVAARRVEPDPARANVLALARRLQQEVARRRLAVASPDLGHAARERPPERSCLGAHLMIEDFALASGEAVQRRIGARIASTEAQIILHHESRERRGEIHSACGDRANRLQHLFQRLRLASIPECADLQRLGRMLLVEDHAQHQDATARRPAEQLTCNGHSRRGPEKDVQHHQIWIRRVDERARLRRLRRFSDDLEVGLRREERAESLAEQPVIVDESDLVAHRGLRPPFSAE